MIPGNTDSRECDPVGATGRRRPIIEVSDFVDCADIASRSRSLGVPMMIIPTDCVAPEGFELLRPISVGPESQLWKVCAKNTGLPYAWKLGISISSDRLADEAAICRIGESAGVPKIHADRSRATPPSIVREWLEGETLRERLDAESRLPVGQACWIGRQVAQSLAGMHTAGYGHGNLRPEHVFLESTGRVRLIGLGFARPYGTAPASLSLHTIADACYRAPEAFAGHPINAIAADAYSLGAILFEAITGRLPFRAESVDELRRLHQQARPPSMRVHCPYLPTEVDDLIATLLSKQPIRRPQHPRELVRLMLDAELLTITFRRAG